MYDKDALNKKVSFFIYNSFSSKLMFAVSFFALDLIKRARRLRKYYLIIIKLQQNKQLIDQKIATFRNNVEEYTRFFVREMKKHMVRINNDIEHFKQSLFIEDFGSLEKKRYSVTKAAKGNDSESKKVMDQSGSQNNFIRGEDKKNAMRKDISINSNSEMKTEPASTRICCLIFE